MGFFNLDFIRLSNQYFNISCTANSVFIICHADRESESIPTVSIISVESQQAGGAVNAVASYWRWAVAHTTDMECDIVAVVRDRSKANINRISFSNRSG